VACVSRVAPCLSEGEELKLRAVMELHDLIRSNKPRIEDALWTGLPTALLPLVLNENEALRRASMRLITKMSEDSRVATVLIHEEGTLPAAIHVLSTGTRRPLLRPAAFVLLRVLFKKV